MQKYKKLISYLITNFTIIVKDIVKKKAFINFVMIIYMIKLYVTQYENIYFIFLYVYISVCHGNF